LHLTRKYMNNRKSRIALITGGNSGIGFATAKVLKDLGDTVIITGRRKAAVEKAAAELGVIPFLADQSKVADIEQLVAAVKREFGQLDILFINAGIVGRSTIEATPESLFDDVMDINFKGAFFTLSRFIPILADGASVVFLSSIVSVMAIEGSSIYCASKAALNALMKTAALELAARKIRVNAVSPGLTETEVLNKAGYTEQELDGIKKYLVDRLPLKRIGHSRDVGQLVAYLCSDASDFITGSEFVIDGGMLLR
jgi:NAD(P)-dependent dehydrogenase (short-subunit alcohol dehydrogenase family)